MITRIYVDNFKTLVNFELKLDRMNLLMGANGSGKSSVFEVMRKLQSFLNNEGRLESKFLKSDLTRWQDRTTQRFEVDLKLPEGNFHYLLLVEHVKSDAGRCRVKQEVLSEGDKPLFSRELGDVQLYRDDHSKGPSYPFDWTLSAMATLQPRNDNQKLTSFREYMRKLFVGSILPQVMDSESKGEDNELSLYMHNFVSWYRKRSQENLSTLSTLFNHLKEILPGFQSLGFKDTGQDSKALKVYFDSPGKSPKELGFDFCELSEGQRVLVVLYVLMFGVRDKRRVLFLDEPDNFVALREIQPWLAELEDLCGENVGQVVLISHHPEVINFMGNVRAKWFYRDADGPTRVGDKPVMNDTSVSLSELVARGWKE